MMPTGIPKMRLPGRDGDRPVEPLDIKFKSNGKELQMQDRLCIKKVYEEIRRWPEILRTQWRHRLARCMGAEG